MKDGRRWNYPVGNGKSVMVLELPSGKWLGSMGNGSRNESEAFQTVQEALDFVGYPWDMVGIPKELCDA